MKIFAIATRNPSKKPEDFAPLLDAEARKSLQFLAERRIDTIWSRHDGTGAVIEMEADSLEAAKAVMAEYPMLKAGLISFEYYPVRPYRGIVDAAKRF